MKKIFMVVVTVGLLMFPVAGFSLDFSEVMYGAFGGFIFPDDLESEGISIELDTGYTIGGQVLIPSGMQDDLSFGLHLSYSMTSGDKTISGTKFEIDVNFIEILPIAIYTLPMEAGNMKFFGQAGLGFARWHADISAGSYDNYDEDIEFGFGFGGGVKITEKLEVVAMYKDFDGTIISITVGYNFGH